MDEKKSSTGVSPPTPKRPSDRSGYASPQMVHEEIKKGLSGLSISNDQEISGIALGKVGQLKTEEAHTGNDVGAGDTSVTDDDIEVICRYSSPRIDELHQNNKDEISDDNEGIRETQDKQYYDQIPTERDESSKVPPELQQRTPDKIEDPAILVQEPQQGLHPYPMFSPGYGPLIYAPFLMAHQPGQDNLGDTRISTSSDTNGQVLHYGGENMTQQLPYLPHNMPIGSMNSPFCYGDIPNNVPSPALDQSVPTHEQPNMYGTMSGQCGQHIDTNEQYFLQPESTESVSQYTFDPTSPQQLPMTVPDQNMGAEMFPNKGYPTMMDLPPRPDEIPQQQAFVYPSIYVSSTGMITVLMKHDVSIEMTVDRTVRVVSHNRNMAVAANARGTSSIMHHPAAKVSQENTTTEVELEDFQAKLTTDNIIFGFGTSCYKFDNKNIELASPKFTDLSMDKSVDVLFASESFGSTLVPQCLHLAGVAEYENLPKGGVIVRINGVKITQTGKGDVTVVTGPKILKVSPLFGSMRITTHFMEMSVDKDEVLRLRRGNHVVDTSNGNIALSNCCIEAILDNRRKLRVYSLPRRILLELPREHKPRPGNPRRKATALGGSGQREKQ